jgi:hypothetical protein
MWFQDFARLPTADYTQFFTSQFASSLASMLAAMLIDVADAKAYAEQQVVAPGQQKLSESQCRFRARAFADTEDWIHLLARYDLRRARVGLLSSVPTFITSSKLVDLADSFTTASLADAVLKAQQQQQQRQSDAKSKKTKRKKKPKKKPKAEAYFDNNEVLFVKDTLKRFSTSDDDDNGDDDDDKDKHDAAPLCFVVCSVVPLAQQDRKKRARILAHIKDPQHGRGRVVAIADKKAFRVRLFFSQPDDGALLPCGTLHSRVTATLLPLLRAGVVALDSAESACFIVPPARSKQSGDQVLLAVYRGPKMATRWNTTLSGAPAQCAHTGRYLFVCMRDLLLRRCQCFGIQQLRMMLRS